MATTAPVRREDARITRSRRVLHVALLQLVEQQPLEAITIREITDAAGVGSATFYRHYPGPVPGDSREACGAILRYVDLQHAVWRALLNGGAAAAVREEIIQVQREVTAAVPHADGWLPLDLSHRFVASAMVELLLWWLERRDSVTVEKGAELLDRLIIGPVIASGGA